VNTPDSTRLKQAFRRVCGQKEQRSTDQDIVYNYIRSQADKTMIKPQGKICPYEAVAQQTCSEMLNKLLSMMDSSPSDEEQKTQVKTK